MKLSYKWNLSDEYPDTHHLKVFSCFSCGGGSTMGYKLAGFDVIGCNEIDSKMMKVYIANHNPKYHYLEPIQDFKNRTDLPDELYNLDILDGSPPCSSFSMAGNREQDWGKEKKFREGQADQILDTLFFDFIDLGLKLQPKVIIAENVKGLLLGEAQKYVRRIMIAFDDAGYYVDYKLLNAARMGVPQRRERVFFYAIRKDLYQGEFADMFGVNPVLELEFDEIDIPYKEIQTNADRKPLQDSLYKAYEYCREHNTSDFAKYYEEKEGKRKAFNTRLIFDNQVCDTITSGCAHVINNKCSYINDEEIIHASAFPADFNFENNQVKYICGMSVPPIMMARIANEVYKQWLK